MTEKLKWATVKEIKEAAEELKSTIRGRYPEAQFALSRAPDDQHIWLLWTYVDVDDPEEVRDLTEERESELLLEKNMLLYVTPARRRAEVSGYRPRTTLKTG